MLVDVNSLFWALSIIFVNCRSLTSDQLFAIKILDGLCINRFTKYNNNNVPTEKDINLLVSARVDSVLSSFAFHIKCLTTNIVVRRCQGSVNLMFELTKLVK